MATSAHSQVDLHPEDLEINQDLPLRQAGIFGTQAEEDEALARLGDWIASEMSRAQGARTDIEYVWEENLQLYEGVPRRPVKNTPFENASNLQVTLGAIACDAIYAQMLNLIFNTDPFITVRPVSEGGELTENGKALQRFAEVLSKSERTKIRPAVENILLDDTKLGTGISYIPWRQFIKKTQLSANGELPPHKEQGPVARGVPVEDFWVPGGAFDDIQEMRWVGIRFWLTRHELELRSRAPLNWRVDEAIPSSDLGRLRQMRERLSRHDGFGQRNHNPEGDNDLYQVFDVYCYYDIDGDGIDEDLLITWDFGSKRVLKWRFNPYDRRPFEAARYQRRSYMFYGLGVVEMLRPYQKGITSQYNNWIDNSQLANTRFWVVRHGALPRNQLSIWPNRLLSVPDPRNDLIPHQMADTYPSAPAALQVTMTLAERRSGVNELSQPRAGGVLGNRTPGITTLALLQKGSERFGPAFDAAREMVAAIVRQMIYRFQERLLMGGEARREVVEQIVSMMGADRARLVIELLDSPAFDNEITVQLTASSASTNREAERQNWLLLVQQVLVIYERVFQVVQLISAPNVPPLVQSTGESLIGNVNELLDRTMRTFDQVRDPANLLIKLEEITAEADASVDQQGLAQLGQALEQTFGLPIGGAADAASRDALLGDLAAIG